MPARGSRLFRLDDWSIAIGVWAAVILGLSAYGYLYPHAHTVYNVYAVACQRWWSGLDIYVGHGDALYRYSPLFAVSLSPFAMLPDGWGNALWRLFNSAVYVVGVCAWARRALPGQRTPGQIAAALLLVLPLSLQSLQNGQANLLMLGSILLGLAAAAEERWNRSAGWLAAATLTKGYPLALALVLSALYPRRFLPRFACALAVGLVLPFAAQGPAVVSANYASWLTHLQDSTHIMRERLRSVDHLFLLYRQPLNPRTFLLMQMAAGLVVLVLCLVHARRIADRRQQLTMAFLLFCVWAALFGPATEACTYVVMAPAAAWLVLDAFVRHASWTRRIILVVSLLLMGPLVTDMAGQTLRNFANGHGSQPIGALLFLAALLSDVGRPSASEAESRRIASQPEPNRAAA